MPDPAAILWPIVVMVVLLPASMPSTLTKQNFNNQDGQCALLVFDGIWQSSGAVVSPERWLRIIDHTSMISSRLHLRSVFFAGELYYQHQLKSPLLYKSIR
jgi:hypothetical protein